MKLRIPILFCVLSCLIVPSSSLIAPVRAEETAKEQKTNREDKSEKKTKTPEPKSYSIERSGRFGGKTVPYTVTAKETFLKNKDDDPTASIFSIAYTKKDVDDPSSRPVTFVFNGGPGSASLWLHMGVFGPRRIEVPSDGQHAGAAPYRIIDNTYSILDASDLVFIDPVGTGFSRALGETKPSDFWGVKGDAQALAEFIRIYVTENKRWNSPKYLAGESYGTTRAVALTHEMQSGFSGMSINGLILVSAILDFQPAHFSPGNDMPYVGYLPSYTATAWYHKQLPKADKKLPDLLNDVRTFAIETYAPALLKGNRLTKSERDQILEQLHNYTGLSIDYLDRANLRVGAWRFMKELMRDEGLSVGRFDSRYTGEDYDDAGEFFDNDPSAYGISGAYVASINDYLTREIGVDLTREYKILPSEVSQNWDWSLGEGGRPSTVNVAPWLGKAMRENKDLRTLVANGYFDLATPFFATENTFSNNSIDPERVTMTYYEAGHMMYTHEPSLKKLSEDVRAFLVAK